jgi:hypothetical protein
MRGILSDYRNLTASDKSLHYFLISAIRIFLMGSISASPLCCHKEKVTKPARRHVWNAAFFRTALHEKGA